MKTIRHEDLKHLAFEPKERDKAIRDLQNLSPKVLLECAEIIKEFNSKAPDQIDSKTAHELISKLTFCYFLVPVQVKQGHILYRGRPADPGKLFAKVSDFGPPPAEFASIGRASAKGESIFYGASSDETAFSELRLERGNAVNIGAFSVRPGHTFIAHIIGEMDYIRRWGRNLLLPMGAEVHAQQFLSALHPNVALAVQLVDAFLADRFSRKGSEEYRVTNLIAQEFLQSQTIDAIIFPSVAHPGGFNYAIKADVSRRSLRLEAVVGVEILQNYGYGSYLGGRYALATIEGIDAPINWITRNDHPEVINDFLQGVQESSNPAIKWMLKKS